MKLLLVLVTAIVVFTADGRDFRNKPGEQETTTDEAQLFPDGTEKQGGAHYSFNGPKQDQQLEKQKKQHERKSQKPKCKRTDVCGVMGGICVTNATLCSGRLVPEGCKGQNCKCCVPGTIEAKFDNFEQELQFFNENMNKSNTHLDSEFQSLKENLNSELQTLKESINSEMQSLKENINVSNTDLKSEIQSLNINTNTSHSKLTSLMASLAAYNGNIIVPTTSTTKLSWSNSLKRCQDMGAQPFVPRTSQDFELIKSVRGKLGSYLWFPASDVAQEGTLKWWNGEAAPSGSPGITWRDGKYMNHNSASWDCVFLGFPFNGVHMWPCSSTEYPMICTT